MRTLPSGTVTFLFTDIEGSTKMLQQLGDEYARALGEHQALLRAAFAAHNGAEVDTQGDAFFVAFPTALAAVAAAADATRALAAHPWPEGAPQRVRIGLHTGASQLIGDHYVGLNVHRAARIAAAGHGGQVLLSEATRVLAEPNLPEGTLLRELGEFQLKDLQRPEHLWQLVLDDLPSQFPPLKTLDRARHNLPVQPTPLLGRVREITELTALVRRDDVRLVTLTGTGGTGKTRLGQQVAAELSDSFPDGVWFVRLARLSDPGLVLPTIARTLGLQEMGRRPLEEQVREYLRTKHLLLLLDNFEHLSVAAPQVGVLLEESPRLKVLVTSRMPLRLRGEKEYPVAPLALPLIATSTAAALPRAQRPNEPWAIEQLTQYAAVTLFIQRALDARPDFQVTNANAGALAEICARLDGLPLAIELAAARVKVLPPQQLLQRLEWRLPLLTGGAQDLLERQQTMRNTLAWSEALLARDERILFRRLAVFVGGCTLEAAEAVCAAPEGTETLAIGVLEGLGRLVDQSLAQQREEDGEARFSLLQVVREYALERLDASGEGEALRQAHVAHYLALAEQGELELFRAEQLAWRARLDRELDNLRAALGWAREHGEAELGLRLASALVWFWDNAGLFSEARGWYEQLFALAARQGGQVVSPETRAKALFGAGQAAVLQGDADRGVPLLEQSLALARGRPGPLAGLALTGLGLAMHQLNDLERVKAYHEESLAQLRLAGELGLIAMALLNLGNMALEQDDLESASASLEESLELARRAGDRRVAAFALMSLAIVPLQQGDLVRAESLGRESLTLMRAIGGPYYIAACLNVLAWIAGEAGWGERAARLRGAWVALYDAIGRSLSPVEQGWIDASIALAQASLGEEAGAAAFAAGRALTLEETITEALGATPLFSPTSTPDDAQRN
jgi:predicted ATPase/class 3 adenylate cyclase